MKDTKSISSFDAMQAPEPLEATTGTQVSAKFDVCIANILRGPLLELQPRLCSYLKPGGTLLLSGILTSQVDFFSALSPFSAS